MKNDRKIQIRNSTTEFLVFTAQAGERGGYRIWHRPCEPTNARGGTRRVGRFGTNRPPRTERRVPIGNTPIGCMPFTDSFRVIRWVVPPVRLVRFPVKFVMLTTFAVPLLAAYGLNWFQRAPAESQSREWRRVEGLALVLAGLMMVIVWFAWKYPLTKGDFGVAAGNALVRAVFLVVILGCIGLLRRTEDLKLQRLFQTGLVVLLWFDVFTHAPNLSPTAPRAAFEPDAVRRAFNWDDRLAPGNSRAMQSKDAFWRMVTTGSADPELDIRGRRLSLSMNLNLLDHAAKFDGFYSLDLRDYYDVFRFAYFKTNEAARLKDFVGISRISNPTNVLDWVPRDSALPMITAGQKPEFAGRAETLSGLLSDRFDPRHTVYLPPEDLGKVYADEQSNVRVGSPRCSSRRLDFQVEADSPALVVVAQSFYHCWHCYVDGKPTQLLRANYAFQGFEVPAGSHRASLVYEDQAFLMGALVSLASALACGAAWLWWGRGRAGSRIGS